MSDFRAQIETNLFGTIIVTKAALPYFRQRKAEGNPDYDSTVAATARFQRDYNGKQPGDPKKAAQAIVRLTQEQNLHCDCCSAAMRTTGRRKTTSHA